MAKTVRDTIKEITRKHLTEKNGLAFGQCLTAVGWVGGTLPELYEEDGLVELSMADVAGGGIVVGSALAGRRPMYVIRYQGFNWYNCPSIVNYAAKSKEIWKVPCPLLVRGIAMEGAIGPVAGSSHHALYYRMPGIKIASPMTPNEYQQVYDNFMKNDDVVYVSEHRGSYLNTEELPDIAHQDSDIVLFPISITRFEAEKARKMLEAKGVKASIFHLRWLKPHNLKDQWKHTVAHSKRGAIVLDDDYVNGVAKSIAHDIMMDTHKPVWTMGLEDRTAGFYKTVDNLPPSAEQIAQRVLNIVENYR
jgi:pyruvate/2-oxoglutarate/acetoin dehydrogenase E1 component